LKVSLNWLKEYVDLKSIPVGEIISKLTMCGLEVEDYIDQNELYKNFVVGFVKEKKKHPNADKLSLCIVSDGKKDYQVICGAPNVDSNQKVVFALEGSIIPKGKMKLKKAKIRGVESNGMICSEAELEISDNHEGIMILGDNNEIGQPISQALGFDDVIMEIAITPNRPDALSHIGVARDLAAIFNLELKYPEININETESSINNFASIEVKDNINCPRYTSRVITEIKIAESPVWLKKKITSIGLRPINNVVDITNFVMYECGQPLHAFDLNLLNDNKIIVDSTKSEITFTTLDSKERKLPTGTLMINDGKGPVAVAGVMGGENSEISNETKNVLIESANFNRKSIRKTSRTLGLSTDSSYRFERSVDPNYTLYAADRAAQLIEELAHGKICEGVIDVYPEKIQNNEVKFRFARLEKLLGYNVDKKKVHDIFSKLGFDLISDAQDEMILSVPTYRPDIEREIDLIEEVARIYGYDNIPTVPKINITLGHKYDEASYIDKIREISVSLGFYEMINNPLQGEKLASMTGKPIKLLNPQSVDMSYLRTSLIPGALSVIKRNINVGEKDLLLFETGNIFESKTEKPISSFDDFEEKQNLILIATGKLNDKTWNQPEKFIDFYDLKGLVNNFITKISLDNVLNDVYYNDVESIFDYVLIKQTGKTEAGRGGKINKKILNEFEIDQNVYCFVFDIDVLKNIKTKPVIYREPLKFPKAIRDFAFIFDKEISFQEVFDFIKAEGSTILKNVSIFDLFENESLGKNKKSMAFTLEFYSEDRTLNEEEVEQEFNKLISAVTKKFNAKLRG